jgi:hypothetical protein
MEKRKNIRRGDGKIRSKKKLCFQLLGIMTEGWQHDGPSIIFLLSEYDNIQNTTSSTRVVFLELSLLL